MRFRIGMYVLVVVGLASPAMAQPAHDHVDEPADAAPEPAHADPVTSREGSGTAWVPETTPMRGAHADLAGWRFMLHGQLAAGIDAQGSERGGEKWISTNWVMGMADREVGGGVFGLRAMLSLEPLTVGSSGYPLLLQSGELYQGEPIVDRQHPHDLVMELAARYARAIAGGVGLELYGGLAGEPALGPVAFPHRPSAMLAPLAPLGHHWLDSTHITFGVVTAGFTSSRVKIEGSVFNGREPDEHRWDLDLRGFDSWSARVQVAPVRELAIQVSYAQLNEPHELHPGLDIARWTASVLHGTNVGGGHLASTLAWGRNVGHHGPATSAVLAESAFDLGRWGVPFARLELVEKAVEELAMDGAMAEQVFTVRAATAGYHVPLASVSGIEPGVGGQVAVTHLPDAELAAVYGNSTLFAAMVFVTLRPAPATAPAGATAHHH